MPAVEGADVRLAHGVELLADDGAVVEFGHGGWVLSEVVGGQRVRGKPRSTLEVAGSGQRWVTTLPRV